MLIQQASLHIMRAQAYPGVFCPQADNINTIVKAAGITVEPYWPSLFAKLFSNKKVEDLICNIGAGVCPAQTAVVTAQQRQQQQQPNRQPAACRPEGTWDDFWLPDASLSDLDHSATRLRQFQTAGSSVQFPPAVGRQYTSSVGLATAVAANLVSDCSRRCVVLACVCLQVVVVPLLLPLLLVVLLLAALPLPLRQRRRSPQRRTR